MKEKFKRYNGEFRMFCVGKDRLIHMCRADSDKTLCGVDVLKKKPTPKELSNFMSCYKCTF